MLRGDSASRGIYFHNLVLDGILTRNEVRAFEGLDPIDGLDEPLVPANEMTLTESNEPNEPVTPPGVDEPAKEQPANGDEGADARLRTVISGNAARLARRIAAGNAVSAEVIAESFAVSLDEAEKFLAIDWMGAQTEEMTMLALVALGSKGIV